MQKIKVAVVVGSIRAASYNRHLALALRNVAPGHLVFDDPRIDDLPLYNQDDDLDQPASVRRFKAAIEAADALLFVTPEYSRSISGVLKNALDHGTRPRGSNSWAGKPAGIAGISPGTIRTAAAQQHLRTILAAMDVPTMAQPELFLQHSEELFDEQHGIRPADTRRVVQAWMDRYVAFVSGWLSHT